MKYVQAYINQWGYSELITLAKFIGLFIGCFQDYTFNKCMYHQI